MQTLTLNASKSYEIIIEDGCLNSIGRLARHVSKAKTAAIITDSNVSALYAETAKKALESEGFVVPIFEFLAGEEQKNITTISEIYSFLAENKLTRNDVLISLGGGVTGDLTGFAAATYMRGIDYIQVPTSLLAQVDSSVGGKTGFDLPQGKNLVGAFWQPKLVVIDPKTLSTLPKKFISDGMAEVIKYGCIKSAELFGFLEACEDVTSAAQKIIYDCVSIKKSVVENDEFEVGERMLLNFGHTVGHAVENLSRFSYSHGEAVSIGMVTVTKAAEALGIAASGSSQRLINLCGKFGLPTSCNFSASEISKAIAHDKKQTVDGVNLILIKSPGESFIKKKSPTELLEFLEIGLKS